MANGNQCLSQLKIKVFLINLLVTNEIKNFPLTNIVLINPGKDSYILDSSVKKEESKGDMEEENTKEESLDINNPDGGLINYAEKKSKFTFKNRFNSFEMRSNINQS